MGQERGVISNRGISYRRRFFFVRPKLNHDSGLLADSLLGIRNVEEVLLTSGDAGFMVKARIVDSEEPQELQNSIESRAGKVCLSAESHYAHRRAAARERQ